MKRKDTAKRINIARWQASAQKMVHGSLFYSYLLFLPPVSNSIWKMTQIKESQTPSPSPEPEPERIPCPRESEKGHTDVTCTQCYTRLDADFDSLLLEMMREEGWTEAQIEVLGSLRRFDKTPFAELVPDSSLSEIGQRRTWCVNLRNELQARLDGMRAVHAARTENERQEE
jgi:hypothetical protein